MKKLIKATDIITSSVSFDFICPGKDYPFTMGDDIMDAIDGLGYEALGFDFRDVDYSHSDYASKNDQISQGGVDFNHEGFYSAKAIEDEIAEVLDQYGCELIGIDFYALED